MTCLPQNRQPWLVRRFALCALVITSTVSATTTDTTNTTPIPDTPAQYNVPETREEVVVDGRLDESLWSRALVVTLDYEITPGENTRPEASTEMFVTYDRRQLYVGFRAQDPDPSKIRARLSDRDRAFQDDIVGITIDTFNDERRAFEFWSNPLGVQLDLFYDDVSGNEDSNWDAIWDSAGRLTETGYVVEMAIPFSSLRFPKTTSAQTWGFDGIRFYPRSERRSFRSQPRDRNKSCYVCQFSKMTGFEGITPGRNLEINPTATGNQFGERTGGSIEDGDVDAEVGLTARWGITPNLNLDVTINPDFSQVETDSAQLEVNNQFALFFREKRPFFLEGADFFETPFNAVHTRTIADPDGGIKLTGKQGPHAIGVFAAEDSVTNILLPGSQGSSLTSIDGGNTVGVVRYRHDIGQRSAIGGLVTAREGEDGYFNRVAGVDGLFRVTDSDTIRFQALSSQTRYPDELAEEFDQQRGELDDLAYNLNYRHNSRNWSAWFTHQSIGEDFRADLGFMPRGNRRFTVAGLQRQWWGEDTWWNRIWLGGDYDVTVERSTGIELEREAEAFFRISGPMQSFLNVGGGQRTRYFSTREFQESFHFVFTEFQPTADIEVGMFARWGDQIDFANIQLGEQTLYEPFVTFRLGRRVKLQLEHEFNRLEVQGRELFTANLSQVRVVYQHNRRMFVRLVSQFLDLQRNPSLYTDSVDAKTQDLLNELLFSYKLNPRTVLFLGYADNFQSDDRIDLTQNNRTLFMKIGYAWVL